MLALVATWGLRLTYNFVSRGGVGHEDWRYTDMRAQFGGYFWIVSRRAAISRGPRGPPGPVALPSCPSCTPFGMAIFTRLNFFRIHSHGSCVPTAHADRELSPLASPQVSLFAVFLAQSAFMFAAAQGV